MTHKRFQIQVNRILSYAAAVLLISISGCVVDNSGKTKDNCDYECDGCNVLLVTVDALRADHLGVYGYGTNTSPNLDAFSKKSYLFENSISQCGTTICSLYSLFASQFPYTDGLLEETREFDTMAELLKESGYRTYAVVSTEAAQSKMCSRGFEIFDKDYFCWGRADVTRAKTIRLLNENTAKPFFMWVHFREPHLPYIPPKRLLQTLYELSPEESEAYDTVESMYYNESAEEQHPTCDYDKIGGAIDTLNLRILSQNGSGGDEYFIFDKAQKLSKRNVRFFTAAYDGNIRFVDEQLKPLFDYLNHSGLTNNTIIIISADHGENLGEHNRFGHNVLYYETIHTPLVVYVPGCGGGKISYPVSNVDILPTVLDILNIGATSGLRGKNLFDSERDDYIQFAEYDYYSTAIKDGWKLFHYNDTRKDRLFYIGDDKNEANNLVEVNPAAYERLRRMISSIKTNYSKVNETMANLDEEAIKKLAGLGYLY